VAGGAGCERRYAVAMKHADRTDKKGFNGSVKSVPKSAISASLRKFITDFNFPNPDWTSLPEGFPNLDKSGLTKEESHLLDGIKLAWVVSEGRETLYKTTAKRAFVGIAIVVLVLLGGNFLTNPEKSLTKSVSAKTVGQSLEEFVEATMSAVRRTKHTN